MPKIIDNLMTAEEISKMDIPEILEDTKTIINRQAQCLVLAYSEVDGQVPDFVKELLALAGSMNDRLAMDVTALDVKFSTRKATKSEIGILKDIRK